MAEKWYIECEKVIDELIRFGMTEDGEAIIRNIPDADVVEVVRCRECKHYNAGFECLIEGYGIERPADYFCADGKRKDGGQDELIDASKSHITTTRDYIAVKPDGKVVICRQNMHTGKVQEMPLAVDFDGNVCVYEEWKMDGGKDDV